MQLSEMVEHFACGAAICAIVPGGLKIQYISSGLAHICEESSESLKENYQADILYGVHPEDREMVRSNLHELAETLKDHEMVFRFVTRAGHLKWLSVKTRIVVHKNVNSTVCATYTDLTEQLNAQRLLSDIVQTVGSALEAANQASVAKSQFLSRVSHELRTPLNAIIGFMELAKGASADEIQTFMRYSDTAARQLLSIINNVLDMSSIESGKLKISHAPFDFKHLINSITNMYVSQCGQKGLKYDTLILTPVDEWLVGDRLRVNQILLNLLNNAVKFTSKGFVKLTVSQRAAQDGKLLVRFEVSDRAAA